MGGCAIYSAICNHCSWNSLGCGVILAYSDHQVAQTCTRRGGDHGSLQSFLAPFSRASGLQSHPDVALRPARAIPIGLYIQRPNMVANSIQSTLSGSVSRCSTSWKLGGSTSDVHGSRGSSSVFWGRGGFLVGCLVTWAFVVVVFWMVGSAVTLGRGNSGCGLCLPEPLLHRDPFGDAAPPFSRNLGPCGHRPGPRLPPRGSWKVSTWRSSPGFAGRNRKRKIHRFKNPHQPHEVQIVGSDSVRFKKY